MSMTRRDYSQKVVQYQNLFDAEVTSCAMRTLDTQRVPRSVTAAVCRSAPRLVQTIDRYKPRMAGERLTDSTLLPRSGGGLLSVVDRSVAHKEDRQMYYSSNQVSVCGLGR